MKEIFTNGIAKSSSNFSWNCFCSYILNILKKVMNPIPCAFWIYPKWKCVIAWPLSVTNTESSNQIRIFSWGYVHLAWMSFVNAWISNFEVSPIAKYVPLLTYYNGYRKFSEWANPCKKNVTGKKVTGKIHGKMLTGKKTNRTRLADSGIQCMCILHCCYMLSGASAIYL